MATGIWVLDLIDHVTRPAGNIDRALGRLETRIRSTITNTNNLTNRVNTLTASFRAAEAAGAGVAGRIGGAWNTVSSNISRANSDMRSMAATAAGIGAAAAGVGFVGKTLLDGMARREMQKMQIQSITKLPGEQVTVLADYTSRFAAQTPFTDNQVMKMFKQTIGYGYNVGETKNWLNVLGDTLSSVSEGPEDAAVRYGMVIRAIGQVRSKGKLMAQEVNQLTEHIPGISAILDEAFGGSERRRKMQEAGKISAELFEKALSDGLRKGYGGGMLNMSGTMAGLASTLISVPQQVLNRMQDTGGDAKPKKLLRNLIELFDTTKQPGKRLIDNLSKAGNSIIDELFGPLADATQGKQAEQLVDSIIKSTDELMGWLRTNVPKVRSEIGSFGDGFMTAADGAKALVAPLEYIGKFADKASGGSGEGVLSKMLGFGVGAVIMARIANWLSLGTLGPAMGRLATAGIGAAKAWAGGWITYLRTMWPLIMQSVTRFGWLRTLGLSQLGTTLAGLGFSGLVASAGKLLPVVGWIIAGLTAVKAVGDALYNRFEKFAALMDSIKGKLSWLFERPEDQTTMLGRAMTFDPVKALTGQKQAWEVADEQYGNTIKNLSGTTGMRGYELEKLIPRTEWRKASEEYQRVAPLGLDTDKNGILTRDEAAKAVESKWKEDPSKFKQEVHIHIEGNVDDATIAAISRAVNPQFANLGLEGGY